MSSTNVNKQSVSRGTELQLETLLTGVTTTLPATTQLVVDGVVYSRDDLAKAIQQELAPIKAVRAARVQLQQSVKDREERAGPTRKFYAAVRSAVVGSLGVDNADLVKFGLKPRKPRSKPSIEERAASLAKAKATREARHTMGSRQKAEVHVETPPPAPKSP